MKIKFLILLLMLSLLSAVGVACKNDKKTSTPPPPVKESTESVEESTPIEVEIIPNIALSHSSITINVGDTFTLTAAAGNVEDAAFSWSIDGESEAGVVSLSQSGNSVDVTAIKEGNVKLIASIAVGESTYYKSVDVTVLQASGVAIVLDGSSLTFNNEGYLLSLSTLVDGELVTYSVYNGASQVNGVAMDWRSGDNSVVEISGNYFKPKGEGVTSVVGTCVVSDVTYSVKVSVEVYRPVEAISEHFTVEVEDLKGLSFGSQILGVPRGISYNGKIVGSYNASTKVATLDKALLPKAASELGEGLVMAVETSLVTYEFTVDMYTKIIKTKADLDAMESIAKSCSSSKSLWDGYFVLGADIEYNDVFNNRIADYAYLANESVSGGNWHNGVVNGFMGVFDGKGHVINGLSIDNGQDIGAIFVVLHAEGVVKNVTFTNASVSANSSLVCGAGGGSVENIYVQFASMGKGAQHYESNGTINNHAAAFFGFKEPTPTASISNCIVDVTNAQFETNSSIKIVGIEYAIIKNVFVIGGNDDLRSQSNATASFETVIEFVEDEIVQNRYSKFDEEFWSLDFGAPISNAVYNQICGREVSFEEELQYIAAGTQYKFVTSNDYAFITTDYDAISVKGGVASVSETATVGITVTVTATSVFDPTKTATLVTTVIGFGVSNMVDLTKEETTAFYDITEGKVYLAEHSNKVEGEILYYVNDNLNKPVFPTKDEGRTTVIAITQNKVYRVVCESVTKVIDSADDLHYLRRNYTVESHGNLGCYDGKITGKFVLINDIDCTGLVLVDSGSYWENSRGFGGTLDGRGYTIKNLSVSSNGLFGTLAYGTIKNVNFTGVKLKANAKGNGEGVALFANSVYNATVDNVSIEFVEYIRANNVAGHSGLMFYEKSFDSTFTNLTLDLTKVENVLFLTECYYKNDTPYGSYKKSTYDNVLVLLSEDCTVEPYFAYDILAEEEIELPKGIRFKYED